MKKSLLLLLLITLSSLNYSLASEACPPTSFIQSLPITNADPHDDGKLWDAETDNFKFEGTSWNVAVQNFIPESTLPDAAKKTAEKLLQTTHLSPNPKKIRSPDNALNICIYSWNGSYGKDLLIVAYQY